MSLTETIPPTAPDSPEHRSPQSGSPEHRDHETLVGMLEELASNLWWSWQPEIRAIFRSLDPKLWRQVHHNPLALLRTMDQATIPERVHDLEIHTRIRAAHRRLHEYLAASSTWAAAEVGPIGARPVAYFSAEFGLHQSLPIYSGGLGVLAGDHLKSMSDLGVPTAAVGLLYHEGYVHQLIDAEGRQQDAFEPIQIDQMAVFPVPARNGEGQLRVTVPLPEGEVALRVWRVAVGRVTLYLLDARDDANPPELQALTARLYGGDNRTRIQQEMLLGVGGHRALMAAGVEPSALHLNEGHSAFALVERARYLAQLQGVDAEAALREVARSSVFTTHTPVEAGHDRFDPAVVTEYLAPLAADLGIDAGELVRRGLEFGDHGPFVTTVLAIRLAHRVNGVSSLHGHVSRRMWHHLYPGVEEHLVPIGHITNGVHARTWQATGMQELLASYLGPDWQETITEPDLWDRVEEIPDAELWEVHQVLKARMLGFVRRRDAERRQREGLAAPESPILDPDALTLGFARRFATYKRADLLLSDMDRLAALAGDAERPVQIIFAGKAHPKDVPGKSVAQRVASLERDPRFAGRMVFVEDYSMQVARQLVQGVDAWLNTPRRPMEACGTSGMKAALNGVPNVSVLDGWWAEAYDGANGFAIGEGAIHVDPEVQDRRAAEAAFEVLESEVVPLFYERDERGLPRGWIRRMKHAMRTLSWRFNADRMVQDYVRLGYLPAAGGRSAAMPR